MSETIDLLTSFNTNHITTKLLSYYRCDTIWKILNMERDENRHSAFLKWLFSSEPSSSISPLIQLLNIVSKNDSKNKIDSSLKKAVLLNRATLSNVEITNEKCISDISKIRYKDRLDLYLTCDVRLFENEYRKMEIILENKIESSEGGFKTNENDVTEKTDEEKEYLKKKQTERYYFACNKDGMLRRNEDKDLIQVFIYLYVPYEKHEGPSEANFIAITYQDLIDSILEPQLARNELDEHSRHMISDYLNNMTTPLDKKYIKMGTTIEEKELLLEFFNNNRELFLRAGNIALENADSEEEHDALENAIKSLTIAKKAAYRFFTVNGIGHFRMYEVIAEFVKAFAKNAKDISVINKELGKAGKQKVQGKNDYRCIVSTDKTSIYRYNLHFHESNLNDGNTFYVTKEFGFDPKSNKNFSGIMKHINNEYKESFIIEEII